MKKGKARRERRKKGDWLTDQNDVRKSSEGKNVSETDGDVVTVIAQINERRFCCGGDKSSALPQKSKQRGKIREQRKKKLEWKREAVKGKGKRKRQKSNFTNRQMYFKFLLNHP